MRLHGRRGCVCAALTRRRCRSGTSEGNVARMDRQAFKLSVILRHLQQQVSEGWRVLLIQAAKAVKRFHRHDDDRWPAMLGYKLGCAPHRLIDDLAELVLRVLNGPSHPPLQNWPDIL